MEVQIEDIMDKRTVAHARMFSKLILAKGSSIGEHQHKGETEYYRILHGKGTVTEKDGEKTVRKGDEVITGKGESIAIKNEGTEDLVFLALIILD